MLSKTIEIKKDSPLEIFLRNINPNLACEIRQCWIEPEAFSIEKFLGKGMSHLNKKSNAKVDDCLSSVLMVAKL